MIVDADSARGGQLDAHRASENFLWRYPEWWSVALSGLAWTVLVAQALSAPGGAHGAHDRHAPVASVALGQAATAADWLTMIAAMMLPLVLGPIRTTAARSLWRRRHRAIGGFLAGYGGAWLLGGSAISLAAAALRPAQWFSPGGAAALGFALAAFWQITGIKQRALSSCHRTAPIAPAGWRADWDCVRYGSNVGRSCVVSCGGLMAACLLAGHSLAAIGATGAVALAERYVARADRWVTGAILASCALVCLGASSV